MGALVTVSESLWTAPVPPVSHGWRLGAVRTLWRAEHSGTRQADVRCVGRCRRGGRTPGRRFLASSLAAVSDAGLAGIADRAGGWLPFVISLTAIASGGNRIRCRPS